MAIHVLANVGVGRFCHLKKQLGALNDHAVVTVAALRRLLVDHRLLQRMQRRCLGQPTPAGIEGRQSFESRDRIRSAIRASPLSFHSPVSNMQVAPPPAFSLMAMGSIVHSSFMMLSVIVPAAAPDMTPATASVP